MKKFFVPILLFLSLAACNQPQKTGTSASNDTLITDTIVRQDSVFPEENAEDTIQAEPAKTTDPVKYIRENVTRINTSKLEKKHYEYMCDEMMKIDYYSSDGDIQKIVVDYGTIGDVYAREDYYYADGKLIFIYEYVKGGPACEGCIETNEYRSYIKNDKVFKYLKNTSPDKCNDCEFSSSSKEYRLLKATNMQGVKGILCP